MKNLKKIAGLLLAAIMALSLSVTSFAAADDGSITVTNAVDGETYNIYQLLTATYSGTSNENISYTVTSDWKNFFTSDSTATTYFDIDSNGTVTLKENLTESDDAIAKAVAKAALAYASTNNISPTKTATASTTASGTTASFTGLDYGYYLVESSVGTVVSIDTAAKSVEIEDKNDKPTVTKVVQEDSTSKWDSSNTAEIGDTVNFISTITSAANVSNLVLHDTMEAGLEFDSNSVEVYVVPSGTTYTDTIDSQYLVDSAAGYYSLDSSPTDGCTFDIEFYELLTSTISSTDIIVIKYSAKVTEDAEIYTDTNDNTTYASYGNQAETTEVGTQTYVFGLNVYKYAVDGQTETGLADASFKLYKLVNGTKYYAVVGSDGNITEWTDDSDKATTLTTSSSDNYLIYFAGLDADDTYYLLETAAPAGYNLLEDPIEIVISATDGSVNSSTTSKYDITGTSGDSTTKNVVKVKNSAGTELPSTGGIGTKIFYAVGGILVLGAAVLLITRRRMRRG